MKTPGRYIIWPANIDSSKTRQQGRRLPRNSCIDNPKILEVANAAKALGLQTEVNAEAARPRAWWERSGYVAVSAPGKKRGNLLKEISRKISQIRSSGKPG